MGPTVLLILVFARGPTIVELPCPDYTNNQLRIASSLLGIIWRLQHLLRYGFEMNIIQLLLAIIRRGDNVSSLKSLAISF